MDSVAFESSPRASPITPSGYDGFSISWARAWQIWRPLLMQPSNEMRKRPYDCRCCRRRLRPAGLPAHWRSLKSSVRCGNQARLHYLASHIYGLEESIALGMVNWGLGMVWAGDQLENGRIVSNGCRDRGNSRHRLGRLGCSESREEVRWQPDRGGNRDHRCT
jgi:hypothetical protein